MNSTENSTIHLYNKEKGSLGGHIAKTSISIKLEIKAIRILTKIVDYSRRAPMRCGSD